MIRASIGKSSLRNEDTQLKPQFSTQTQIADESLYVFTCKVGNTTAVANSEVFCMSDSISDDELYGLLNRIRSERLPSSETIVGEAAEELGLVQGAFTANQVLSNFNNNLRQLFERTLTVLERYEQQVYSGAVMPAIADRRRQTLEGLRAGNNVELISSALQALYPDLWRVFLSRSQSRKQRGGGDFQEQIKLMFQLANIPFEEQTREYRTDFVIPSQALFQRDRTRAIIFSVKRTLRERWQEVVDELHHTNCPNVYLATANESRKITLTTHIAGLRRYNMHLVVWDTVKAEKFPTEPVVRNYTEFATIDVRTFQPFWNP